MTTDLFNKAEHMTITNQIAGLGAPLRRMGDAYKVRGESHYTVKLFILPHQKYFLAKSPYKCGGYTLYSGEKCREFFGAVGSGRKVDGTNYVKVDFHDLKLSFFLRFGPRDDQFSRRAA